MVWLHATCLVGSRKTPRSNQTQLSVSTSIRTKAQVREIAYKEDKHGSNDRAIEAECSNEQLSSMERPAFLAACAPASLRPRPTLTRQSGSLTAFSKCRTSRIVTVSSMSTPENQSAVGVQMPRREFLSSSAFSALLLVASNISDPHPAYSASQALAPPPWMQVDIPSESTLFDLSFSPTDPSHGFLVGTKGSVLETTDGGNSWLPRSFATVDADEELNYRFEVVTFLGDEGWVIGKPALLLYTSDGGKSWERVALSPKLPGEPVAITALGKQKAEMTTNAGAVYITENAGKNWKAQVRETIDATLNRTISSGVTGASYFTGSIISVLRDQAGGYLAVSSRGNFFLTWRPGQDFWVPHARDTSRRIQAMGFVKDNLESGIWMSTRGGGLSFTDSHPDLNSTETFKFNKLDIKSGGYGILDVSFRPDTEEVWASLGGGNLLYSRDGGNTWQRPNMPKVGSTIYKIKFFSKEKAFALGSNGVLLKYNPDAMQT